MIDDWKKCKITSDTTIEDAAKVINDNSDYKIALVLDASEKLIGTVTDGDIRRAIINHISLENPVYQIMNKSPRVIHESEDKKRILSILDKESFLQIPIVNDLKQVVAIETLQNLTRAAALQNRIVIMAGGFGMRLRPLTDNCPKPMLSLGEKPLLEHIITDIIDYGFSHFTFSVHYLHRQIYDYFENGKKWGIDISYYNEATPLGTAGCLKNIVSADEMAPLIIANGDVLTRVHYKHMLDYHMTHKADITVCIRNYEIEIPYGVVDIEQNNLLHIEEKPIQTYFVNAGIYVVNPDIIRSCSLVPPYHMTDLITNSLKLNKKIVVFPMHEYWMDIGRVEDYETAQENFLLGI